MEETSLLAVHSCFRDTNVKANIKANVKTPEIRQRIKNIVRDEMIPRGNVCHTHFTVERKDKNRSFRTFITCMSRDDI